MWELIINAVGWIVGGALDARAGRLARKTGIIYSESEKQIAEISGSAAEDASKEKTKQALLGSVTAKIENEKPAQFPVLLAGGLVLAVTIFLLHTAQNVEKENGS